MGAVLTEGAKITSAGDSTEGTGPGTGPGSAESVGELLLVAGLGNIGIAAVATLLSALAAGLGRGANLLVVLVLPLVIPVVLAAAEATRLLAENHVDEVWWRWVQLLGAFAIVYVTAGTVLFEHAIEE